MATGFEGEINVRDLSTAVGASRRSRLLQAVLAAAAIIALLAFVHVLRPGASEITVASGTLRTLDSAPDKRIPPNDPPAPSGPPAPPPVAPPPAAQDDGSGDDATPDDSDDEDDDSAEEEAQQQEEEEEEQQQQDDEQTGPAG